MFNSGRKKEAIKALENTINLYNTSCEDLISVTEKLYDIKNSSLETIKDIEVFLNNMTNKPKSFDAQINTININIKNFDQEILKIKKEFDNIEFKGSTAIGAGAAAGVAVASLGPTAAMAVATTFGTASTGVAISGLSGAVATNAALAWLGGGALAAGGGGMVAGDALLALAGPIGWAIGGAAAFGGGLYMSSKNKRAAEEIEEKVYIIKKERTHLEKANFECKNLFNSINKVKIAVRQMYVKFMNKGIDDYLQTTDDEKYMLMTMINETKSLSELINRKLKTGK